MSAVEALSNRVKAKIETANEAMIRHARPRPGVALLPNITGKTGSTHGASMVKTPEIKLTRNKIILVLQR